MMADSKITIKSLETPYQRLLSLDFLRGFIMVLLALESTGLYEHLFEATEGNFLHSFFLQFFHHPWNGLRFWDLIQPGFHVHGRCIAGLFPKETSKKKAFAGMLPLRRH